MKTRNDLTPLSRAFYQILTILCGIVLVFSLLCPNYAHAEGKTVRVGWFYQEDIQEGTLPGDLRGYNYEYLQKIALYTGWNYEFVFTDWDSCVQMLKDGEIDILGYVAQTTSRQDKFLFSSNESGRVSLYLISADPNASYITGDYSELQGATIATISSSFRTTFLNSLAEKHGVHVTYKTYDTQTECFLAVDRGEADYAYVSDIGNFADYHTVLQLPEQPFYFAVSPEREDLLVELDDAMSSILASNSNFNEELTNKYIASSKTRNPVSFTKSEQNFIRTCGTIRVAVSPDIYPMSYEDDNGDRQGFIFQFLDLLSEQSGLSFKLIYYNDHSSAITAVKNGQADITLQSPDNYTYAQNRNMILSQPFITIQQGLIHVKGNEVKSIGVRNGQFVDSALTSNSDYELIYYKNMDDCMADLINGKTDSALVNIYLYQRLVQVYSETSFQFQPLAEGSISYCIGINDSCNPQLVYILDKTIGNISEDQTQAMLTASSSVYPKVSTRQWLHNNRFQLLLIIAIATGIILYFVIFFERRMTRLEKNTNLTLSEKNEELKKANAAKSDFLSRTSHDLRTPMNAIMGLTALALDETSTMKKDLYLSQIANSSELLLGLINDVLDMDKIENGAIELKPEPYPFPSFAQLIRNMIMPLCRQKNIDFVFEDINVKEIIVVDRVRFNQIFFNLLSNAVKFTPEGGTVTFEVKNSDAHDGIIDMDFVVADTGLGMTEEFMEHMFEPFSQEQRPSGSQGPGTGLGLAIVKNMVDLMGGTIEVQSHLNEGTIFHIRLTAPITQQTMETKDASIDIDKLNAVLRDKEILLVDDHPLNLEVARKILEKKEIRVTTASDGSQAVKTFADSDLNHFDAILMDIRMPVMNGMEAARAIRALKRKDARSIPIIAMTANTLDEDKDAAAQAGMDAHLGKPIVPKELFECLYEWLNED